MADQTPSPQARPKRKHAVRSVLLVLALLVVLYIAWQSSVMPSTTR
jgi:hypothetical protein